ncbi:XRE family transcriptional regulator [Curtobacterium sp. APC 4022]|uniref:helix-turn-helix domain-containing protein n=1 Tax=Curtobacterium sp. APC 4022 TaxID=3035201 RepID=UPI0025B35D46|nr:XRE family transcriptional regulator [Curtobacterium sp. APC 4022]MDN3478299.1 XRE family transcriptional regulator [Curtobacterium sp. APC 4022]
MDAEQLGSRIRQERERARLSQIDLASKAELDRTVMSKIESGVRKVTALELMRIAEAVGIRMARFFEEPIPAIVSHRSSQGLDTAESQVDAILDFFAHDVEFVLRLAPDALVPSVPISDPFASPQSADDAEALAVAARRLLRLDDEEPVLRLQEVVSRLGLWALSMDFGPDTADAGSLLLKKGAVALVNSHNKVGRRRLALAHELGHFLVQDEYSVDWRVSDPGSGIEARLDRFARALLLPSVGFRSFWTNSLAQYGLRDAAVLTASRFQVDMSTLARRIGDLRLEGDGNAIRSTQTVGADIVEHGLLVSNDLEGTSLPQQYQRAIIGLYRAQQISVERAVELLRGTLTDSDLPQRRKRVEGELWNFLG